MIYKTKKGRVSSGEAIGILLLDTSVPFIPGDVANASTYPFPVRFQIVEGFTVKRALEKDPTIFDNLLEASLKLLQQGVRAITGDCGFMGIHQQKLSQVLDAPVFLSSLMQTPFIQCLIGKNAKVGVITAHSKNLDETLLKAVGVSDPNGIVIAGLEDQPNFRAFAIEETGFLDTEGVEKELVLVAKSMVNSDPSIGSILLECSLLPPYGAAVQGAVDLPIFDYITMIKYVFSAVVKTPYNGFM